VVDGSGDTPQRVETPSSVTPSAGNSPAHHTTPCHANPTPTNSIPMTTMTPGGSLIASSVNPVTNSSSQENHLLIEPLANLAISKQISSPTTDANNNDNSMMHKGSVATTVALDKNDTDINNNNAEGSSKVGGATSGDVTSPNSQQMSHPDSSAPEAIVVAQQQSQPQPNMPPQTLPLPVTNKRAAQDSSRSSSISSSQGEALPPPQPPASSSNSVEQQSSSSMYSGSVTMCSNNPRKSVSLEAAVSSPIKTPENVKENSNAGPLCSSKCGVACSKSMCLQTATSGTAAAVVGQCCGSGGLPSNRSSSLSNLLPSANMSAPPAGLSSLGGPLGGWSSNNSNTSWCPQHSGGTVGSPVAPAVCWSPIQGSQSWTGLGWPHSPVMRSSSTTSLNTTRVQNSCLHHKSAASPRSTSLPPPPRTIPAPPLQQPPPRPQPTSPTNSSCSTSSMRTSSIPPGPLLQPQQQATTTSSSAPIMSAMPHYPMEPGGTTAIHPVGAPQPPTTYGYMSPHSPIMMMPYYQYGAGMVPPYYQWGPPQPVMMQWAPQPMGPPTPTPMCSTPTRNLPPHPAMQQPPTGVYQLLAAPHTPQREAVWRNGAPGTSPRTLNTKVLFSPGNSKMSSPRTGATIPPKPGYRVSLADYKPRPTLHKPNLSPRKFPHPLLAGSMAHSYGSLPEAALRGLRPLADDRCAMMPITPPPTPHDDALLSVSHFSVS